MKDRTIFGPLTARMNRYRFQSTWRIDSDCDHVFHTLQQVALYPVWWPDVKHVATLGDATVRVVVRATLPYKLRFELRQELADSQAGVLEASMTGDLEGWSRWSVTRQNGGCLLKFEEDVLVNRSMLKLLSPLARPVLQANHSFMMRRGEKGLRLYLSRNSRPYSGLEGM